MAINALGPAPSTTASASRHARGEVNKCGAMESAKHDETMSIPCSGSGCEAKVAINAEAHDTVRGSGGAHGRFFCDDCSAETTAAIESLMTQLEGATLRDALQPTSAATTTAANAAAEAAQLAPQSQKQPCAGWTSHNSRPPACLHHPPQRHWRRRPSRRQ